MSVVLQTPAPKPRRKPRTTNDTKFTQPTTKDIELNETKVLDELRQSIEKSDNTDVMKNNLFESEIPDKMEKRRRHRKSGKLNGNDNLSFEPEAEMKEAVNSENETRETEEKPRRRRRRPKQDVIETQNEELSNQAPSNEIEQTPDGDTVKPRHRRRKKDKQVLIETNEEETNHVDTVTDPMNIDDEGRVLNIMIHRTDRLKTDLNVLHPMIRVHIMDISTGKIIVKQNRDRKVTSCNEDIENVTTILPVMTQPFDFKSRRVTIPAWEESLIFNENANYLIKNPNVIYLFEVLDLNPAYNINKTYRLQQENSGFHQIAWGFLRPIGTNGDYNTDHKVRLQLYENGPLRSNNDLYSSNVFYWWNNGFRKPYPSTLYVTVAGIILNPHISSEFAMRSMFPNQKEGAPNGLVDSHLPGKSFSKNSDASTLSQWMRLPSQMCHIPNVPQIKLISGADGANVLAFSPDGNWLACGAVETTDNFPVLIYDLTKLSRQMSHSFVGHNRIIHNLAWCNKSEFLASASADGTCRVWRIKIRKSQKENEITQTITTNDDNDEGNVFGYKRILCHPCFVYAVAFHPRVNTILTTAGYDKVIRIWDLSINKKKILYELDGHKGFINCLLFSSDGRSMYSGDAKGEIHVWDIPSFELNNQSIFTEKWKQSDIITEPDIKGVIINHMTMHPSGKRLFVHSRDGSIRLIDLKIKTMVLKFHGIVNSEKNLRCCLSPCGSFLFSGSEDCNISSQVYVWNAQTGDHVAVYKDLGFAGPVSSIDYHPKCHMIAFTSIGSESSITIYTYSSEKAQYEMGYHSGSDQESPKLKTKQSLVNIDNLTRLDEVTLRSRNFENDVNEFNSFKNDYEQKSVDRLSRILNTLNTVTKVDQTLRSANRSMERSLYSTNQTYNDGYISGPEDKGRLMRSSSKSSNLQSIPMTLNMTSTSKANFTFKPPPASKHKEQTSKYLGEVVALYDYKAERSDEISFASGEIIKIVFRDGKNWLLGETRDGKQGYVPVNYVAGDESIQEPKPDEDNLAKSNKPKTRFKDKDEIIENEMNTSANNTTTNNDARSRRRRDSALKDTILN